MQQTNQLIVLAPPWRTPLLRVWLSSEWRVGPPHQDRLPYRNKPDDRLRFLCCWRRRTPSAASTLHKLMGLLCVIPPSSAKGARTADAHYNKQSKIKTSLTWRVPSGDYLHCFFCKLQSTNKWFTYRTTSPLVISWLLLDLILMLSNSIIHGTGGHYLTCPQLYGSYEVWIYLG